MRTEDEVREIQKKVEGEFNYIKLKLEAFMYPEKLSKLSKDYFELKGWLDCLKWVLTNGTKRS